MKKMLACIVVLSIALVATTPAYALESNATKGEITGKTVVAGICSFLLWPGIGQYINGCEKGKNITHAVAGLFPLTRFWSGWDALVERKGGYWKGRL